MSNRLWFKATPYGFQTLTVKQDTGEYLIPIDGTHWHPKKEHDGTQWFPIMAEAKQFEVDRLLTVINNLRSKLTEAEYVFERIEKL